MAIPGGDRGVQPQNSSTRGSGPTQPSPAIEKGDRGYQPQTGEHPWTDQELLNRLSGENN